MKSAKRQVPLLLYQSVQNTFLYFSDSTNRHRGSDYLQTSFRALFLEPTNSGDLTGGLYQFVR